VHKIVIEVEKTRIFKNVRQTVFCKTCTEQWTACCVR